jgi:hypothetical protein
MPHNLTTPAGVKALREHMMAERERIMRELGLTGSPTIVLPAIHRRTSKVKTRSSEQVRRLAAAAEEEQKEAAAKGTKRQRLHPNIRLLQEQGLPIPERSRVGSFRVRFERPGATRVTSKRRH